MTAATSHFAKLGEVADYESAFAAVAGVLRRIDPELPSASILAAFDLIERAFSGRLPDYQRLQTLYHNSVHTFEVALCAARLLHGLHVSGATVPARLIDAVMIAALFHDAGYLKKISETGGTGAQFTDMHILRSMRFAETVMPDLDVLTQHWVQDAIQATDHRIRAEEWLCDSEEGRLAAEIMATADTVGQMASREYLERLLFLYYEFREAGMGDFDDLHDLLEQTIDFYRRTRRRLYEELHGTVDLLKGHFAVVEGERENHYMAAIDQNIGYLEGVLKESRDNRLNYLKRGGIVERAKKL